MPQFDLSLPELRTYHPFRSEPTNFDAFWNETLKLTRTYPLEARFKAVETGLVTLEAFDVTFNGDAGQPIKARLLLPRQRTEPLPFAFSFIGYGARRGFPTDSLLIASLGYANLVIDTRAQTLFSVGLMDAICPPSTVYEAYNQITTNEQICVYPHNGHEGGQEFQAREVTRFLKQHFGQ